MPENLHESLLASARDAYAQGDKPKADSLIIQILEQDFTFQGAWELLHQQYGAGYRFEAFQRAFARRYFPDQLHLLPQPATSSLFPISNAEVTGILTPEDAGLEEDNGLPKVRKNSPLGQVREGLKALVAALSRLLRHLPGRKARAPEDLPAQARTPDADPAHGARDSEPAWNPPRGHTSHSPPTEPVSSARRELRQRDIPTQPAASPLVKQSMPATVKAPLAAAKMPGANATPVLDRDLSKIRVLVVDDIPQTRENIAKLLRFQAEIEVVGMASNGAEAIQVAVDTRPDVVLMDINMPDMDGITATAGLLARIPTAQVVILTVQDDLDYMRQAMRAGARDFLTKPPNIEELLTVVLRAGEMAHQEQAKMTAAASQSAKKAEKGKIITVYSPKGGIGCTTLAANLAVTLHNAETPLVLVDGNLEFGDVMVFFNELGKYSIFDLAQRAEELDREIVEEVLVRNRSGIRILAAPRPEQAEQVTGKQFARLLDYLSDLYPYVVVDAAHHLAEVAIEAIDASNLVILVTNQEVPAIASIRKFLDLAPLLELSQDRVMIVMNQYDRRIDISPEKVKQILQKDIVVAIPLESRAVLQSINRGVPFMQQSEAISQPLGRAVLALAEAVRQRLSSQNTQINPTGDGKYPGINPARPSAN